MQTVDKSMRLLGLFTLAEPEIGLSALARAAELDKAATRRCLVALAKHGLIEQNAQTRSYRLGPALLRLARIREATVPLHAIVQPILDRLARETGETAHASILAADAVSTIAIAEPDRATRVYVDPSQPLPLHATASGLACLAFLDPPLAPGPAGRVLPRFTAETPTDARVLAKTLAEVRKQGFARAARTFGDDVVGTAAPILDGTGRPIGAVAVAAMASRFTAELAEHIAAAVLTAGAEATRATGGEPAIPAPSAGTMKARVKRVVPA